MNPEETVSQAGLIDEILSGSRALLELGGPVVAILLAMSVVGLAIALYKFLQLSSLGRGRFDRVSKAVDAWIAGNRDDSIKLLDHSHLKLAADVRFGLEQSEATDGDALRDELARRGANFLQPYSAYLRPLELIYYLAPVLGLLGTVLGMIDAFRGLEVSVGQDNDSTALAGGIWEALLTTAVGLSIAIPFTLIHAWLEARLDVATARVNDILTRVMTANVWAHK